MEPPKFQPEDLDADDADPKPGPSRNDSPRGARLRNTSVFFAKWWNWGLTIGNGGLKTGKHIQWRTGKDLFHPWWMGDISWHGTAYEKHFSFRTFFWQGYGIGSKIGHDVNRKMHQVIKNHGDLIQIGDQSISLSMQGISFSGSDSFPAKTSSLRSHTTVKIGLHMTTYRYWWMVLSPWIGNHHRHYKDPSRNVGMAIVHSYPWLSSFII